MRAVTADKPPVKGAKPEATTPVTVTFTGELAAAIRSAARESRRTPQQIAENYCEGGCDRPFGASGRMFIEIPDDLRGSIERLAKAAGYKDGVVDLALETWIDRDLILDSVVRTLIRLEELDRQRIGYVAAVAMEERIRVSDNPADQWMTEHLLGKGEPKR